jgi:putative aminopeptidase FrvX
MQLLKKLCSIHAPSGNEGEMTNFLIQYIEENKSDWKSQPEIFSGEGFQNCIVLIFGKPRTAVFAHIDSIGFTVRYNNSLVKIGSPKIEDGYLLKGFQDDKSFEYPLKIKNENEIFLKAPVQIERGIDLTFKENWREDKEYVQCCYMDNRLGVWNALKLCESITNGAIVFSCWEEHGGGSVPYLIKFLYEGYNIRQALISDITWVTEGVIPGKGVVVSLRDTGIPRKKFIDRIIQLSKESGIAFQKEVEGSGGSDGTEIQKQPYPIDWCFVGAPEQFVHSPDEKVHKADIQSMIDLYTYLMDKL